MSKRYPPQLPEHRVPKTAPQQYQVGKFYDVPCVQYGKQWIPIIGPRHEDQEIIGFPILHWHVDVRFMSDRQLYVYDGRVSYGSLEQAAMALPVSWYPPDHPMRQSPMYSPIGDTPVLKRRKCHREMPNFPWQAAPWKHALPKAYAHHCLNLDRPVCPHRGFPLEGLPCDRDGVVTCPGHGLRWDMSTGKVVIP